MALFWSKKPKAEKNYEGAPRKTNAAGSKPRSGAKAATTKAVKAPAKAAVKTSAVAIPSGRFDDTASVIVRPHITEKSGLLSQSGVYTFQVSESANKATVAKAVKSLYKITPVKIAIVNLPNKKVFVKGRFGSVTGIRKALVTVKKGDKIDFV